MVKGRGAGCGRNQDPGGADAPGITVGGSVDHSGILFTGHLCNEGGRAAAVQICCFHAACFQQDLCQSCIAAAGREGLLSAVQNQHNHLAGLGKADGSTAGPLVRQTFHDLAVLDQPGTEAGNSLLHLALINSVIFFLGADDRRSVLQNPYKACRVNGVILHALHDQYTAGLTGLHIEAGAVGGNDHIVVFYIKVVSRVAVTLLSSQSLVQNTLHFPALCGIVIVVVGMEADILTGQVAGSQIIDDLLAVGSSCHNSLLVDAGGKLVELCRESSEQAILSAVHIVASQLTDIVGKGIANCLPQGFQIRRLELPGAFQSGDDLIGGVGLVYCIPNIITGAQTAQAVIQEVGCTGFHGQLFGKICHQNCIQTVAFIVKCILMVFQIIHKIHGIQVAEHIGLAKAADVLRHAIRNIVKQIVILDLGDHFFQRTGYPAVVCKFQQVYQVTGPAAHIGVVLAEIVVIGDIHSAEHMANIHIVTVRQIEACNVLQATHGNHLIG